MLDIEKLKKVTIGVDLGTTNTCAAIAMGSTVTYLDLEANSQSMPSAVRFLDSDINKMVIGRMAKRMAIIKPKEVFTSFKTLMQNEEWLNDPTIVERYKVGGVQLTPTDMAAKILTHIYEIAQKTSFAETEPITNILVCVPAASTPYYKKEVMKAAIAAGFGEKDENGNVVLDDSGRAKGISILSEPVAASYSYGMKNGFFDPEKSKEQNIMVYDFGGGTFDVTILNVLSEKDKEPEFKLLGTFGITHLGGDDIDEALMRIVAKQFYKETKIDLLDPLKDNKGCSKKDVLTAQSTLKELAERAKIEEFAVGAPEAHFEQLSIIHDNEDDVDCNLDIVIKRENFLEAIKPLIDRTFECIENALKESSLSLDDINRFVLVGGSTKGPWVQEAVKAYIGKEPFIANNVDVVVAEGAAFYSVGGGTLLQRKGETRQDIVSSKPTVIDKTSQYLGVEIRGGYFIPLIEKGKPFDDDHPSYSGSVKCTNPNNSSFVYITGWATQTDVLERDEQGNPILTDEGNLLSNYSVHYIKDGEKVFQPLGQFGLNVPKAEPHTLSITLKLTVLKDNSITLEVKVGDNEPQIQTW